MKIRALVAAALLAASLTACSGGGETSSKESAGSPSPSASKAAELAPVWQPKLDTAAEGAMEICTTPSSASCATALTDIMLVVNDIESAIAERVAAYPETTKQIAKMQEATDLYVDEGCQGDPAADGPDSRCHGATYGITIGSASLGMTLLTDDMSLRPRP
ncbi:hypothetical protein [Streptomyces sp. NPDC006267]|uniref:hypothetical protein n=1 Tax=Streptomyces sp. NPDC006267 TaxID=3157173 RepID=UPI0033BB1861